MSKHFTLTIKVVPNPSDKEQEIFICENEENKTKFFINKVRAQDLSSKETFVIFHRDNCSCTGATVSFQEGSGNQFCFSPRVSDLPITQGFPKVIEPADLRNVNNFMIVITDPMWSLEAQLGYSDGIPEGKIILLEDLVIQQ